MASGRIQDVHLDGQVFPNEITGEYVIGENPANPCGSQEDEPGLLCPEERIHVPGVREIQGPAWHSENIGGGWHTDHSYDREPALGSMLYAHEVPDVGGDTMFSSMYRAYETLSSGMRTLLGGLRAHHSSRHVFGHDLTDEYDGRLSNPELATQDAFHPVVISHPLTGRKALYVNPGFTVGIEGWTTEESSALLGFLYQHAVRPEFTCRFRWEKGSIAFWDNRATWHYALNDYPGERRYLHRITIEGTALAA